MEYKKYKDRWGICIDWETSGSDWDGDSSKTYQGISFGAVIYDTQTFEEVDSLYREIKFDDTKYKWSAEAENIHGLSKEHLQINGVDSTTAAVDFAKLILKYFDINSKILVLGHNRDYDIAFTKQLLEPHGIMFKVSHTNLDTSGVGVILASLHKSDDIFHYLGLPPRTKHNALEDARMTVEACKRFRLIFQHAMSSLTS